MTRKRTTSTSIGRPDPVIIPDDIADTALAIFAAAIVVMTLACFLTVVIGGICAVLPEAVPAPGAIDRSQA